MISKLGASLLVALATLAIATPDTFAATPTQNKIKKYYNQLRALPFQMAPSAKVISLVIKLVDLDPAKSSVYYGTGVVKFAYANAKHNVKALAAKVVAIVRVSSLPSRQASKVVAAVNRIKNKYHVPPKPYGASLFDGSSVAALA